VSDPARPTTTRRNFIRQGAAAVIVVPVALSVLGCSDEKNASAQPAPPTTTPTPPAAPLSARQRADQMDAMHEKGIKAFPAKTAGKGNQLFIPKLVGGVKVYEVTCSEIDWEVEPGRTTKAWAYNGQVPEGD